MTTRHDLLTQLIACPSVTPEDAGCQAIMIRFLQQLGFSIQLFNQPPVYNFYAEYGHEGPLLVFAGHTDVVPIGERQQWLTDPFQLSEKNGWIYGRGVADMKGSLACMLLATQSFLQANPQHRGKIGFLITSAEEGDDYAKGTPYVMQQLQAQGICPDYCIVGEPSSSDVVGDVLRVGRRGSLTAKLTLKGKQGHVAYPHLAENPIHRLSPALFELTSTQWDQGNAYFPPTSMQITAIQAGGQASNIIPGEIHLQFNFRYSTEQTAAQLQQQVDACFLRHQLNPIIEWQHSGEPFLTSHGHLLDSCIAVIEQTIGKKPVLSTDGGTSDARFIAPYGIEVLELGPQNATIHQVNECLKSDDLTQLQLLYQRILERIF